MKFHKSKGRILHQGRGYPGYMHKKELETINTCKEGRARKTLAE